MRVKKLSAEERAKYDNWKDLEGDNHEKYMPVKERFTTSQGRKKEFCDSMFSDDGHKMFHGEEDNWDSRVKDMKMRKWLDKGLRKFCKEEGYFEKYLVDKETERKMAIQHAKKE